MFVVIKVLSTVCGQIGIDISFEGNQGESLLRGNNYDCRGVMGQDVE